MNINRNRIIWLILLSCIASACPTAMAQSRLQTTSELSGIENVLGIIRHVNLGQMDQSSNQFILDIMDTKTDVYGQNSALSNGKKAPVVTQNGIPSSKTAPLPPARHLKTF